MKTSTKCSVPSGRHVLGCNARLQFSRLFATIIFAALVTASFYAASARAETITYPCGDQASESVTEKTSNDTRLAAQIHAERTGCPVAAFNEVELTTRISTTLDRDVAGGTLWLDKMAAELFGIGPAGHVLFQEPLLGTPNDVSLPTSTGAPWSGSMAGDERGLPGVLFRELRLTMSIRSDPHRQASNNAIHTTGTHARIVVVAERRRASSRPTSLLMKRGG